MQAAGIVALALNYAPFEPERLAYLKMLIESTGGRWRDATQPTRIDAECEVQGCHATKPAHHLSVTAGVER